MTACSSPLDMVRSLSTPTMPKHAFDKKVIAGILVCILSSIVLLGASAGPPFVEIQAVHAVEEGTTVRVLGVLVDLRMYDSGAEGMTLADLRCGAVVRVVSSPGIRPQPSTYVGVGDELLIEGEIGRSESGPVIFAVSDGVSMSRDSELVLTVEAVSRNWVLFEGDTIRVKGVLMTTGLGVGLRLYDCSGNHSMAVASSCLDLGRHVGSTVTLTATLRFDHGLSMLVLTPSSVMAEQ